MDRSLDQREREVLVTMIERGDTDSSERPVTPADRARWLAQVPQTRVEDRCSCGICPSVVLTTGGAPAAADAPRVVLMAGVDEGLVLLFVDDDRLSYLELAAWDDERHPEFPPAAALRTGAPVSDGNG